MWHGRSDRQPIGRPIILYPQLAGFQLLDTRTLCLGALKQGPCSGYEIRKRFEEGPFGHFQDISFGSIYPALRRLTDDGLVTVTDQEQDRRPDKKVYEMTPQGHLALARMVSTDPASDKFRSDLLFSIFFADLLPADRLAELVENRILQHESIVRELSKCEDDDGHGPHCPTRPGPEFVRGLGLTIHRACLAYYRNNRNFLIEGHLTDNDEPTGGKSDSHASDSDRLRQPATTSGRTT